MDPLIAKLLFALGYLVPIIAIRGPHIKAKKTQTFRQDRKVGSDTAAFVLTTVGNAFVPLLFIVSPVFWFADYESPLWAGIVGAVLLIPGHWFFYRSHRDLGKNWSPVLEVREGHTLVTGGIYRRIRHPMYTSVWLFVIAQALLLPNWIAGFGGLIPFTFLYFLRVGKEERLMLEEFGDEYAEYRKGTGRLFPKLQSRREMKERRHILEDGREVTIREAAGGEAAELLAQVEAISAESTFVSMSPGGFGMTVEREAEFVEECRSAENCLYLVARSEDQLVGGLHFGAKNRRRVRHMGEFGMSVRKEFWGQVIGAATLGLLIEWGRLSGVVTKINLRVRTDNARAIGLYESRGFEREGTIRRDFMVDGEYFDHHLMGLIV